MKSFLTADLTVPPLLQVAAFLSTTRWASAFIFEQQNPFVLPVILKSNKL